MSYCQEVVLDRGWGPEECLPSSTHSLPSSPSLAWEDFLATKTSSLVFRYYVDVAEINTLYIRCLLRKRAKFWRVCNAKWNTAVDSIRKQNIGLWLWARTTRVGGRMSRDNLSSITHLKYASSSGPSAQTGWNLSRHSQLWLGPSLRPNTFQDWTQCHHAKRCYCLTGPGCFYKFLPKMKLFISTDMNYWKAYLESYLVWNLSLLPTVTAATCFG